MTDQNVVMSQDDEMAELLAIHEAEQKAKKEAENNKGNFIEFEHVECLGLEDQKEKAFRIVGRGFQNRKLSTDAKMIMQSSIRTDDGKGYTKINWPISYIENKGDYFPDPDWILTKLFNTVNKGKWYKYSAGILKDSNGQIYPPDYINPITKKDGERLFDHKDTEIFMRINSNMRDNPSLKEFAPNFYPVKRIVINVIDRMNDWCLINKHTKELSSKVSYVEKKNEKGEIVKVSFSELGVPKLCYDGIINHYLKTSGSFAQIDTVIVKDSTNKKYDIYDAMDDRYLKETKGIASCNPLTEEEKSYELYDFDNIYRIASYAKLKKNLTGLFKLCDIELETKFYDELVNLCKIEDEQKKAEEKAKVKSEVKGSSVAESVGETKTREVRQSQKKSVSEKTIEQLCVENFPSWGKVPDNEKQIMIESIISFKDAVPVYTKEAKDVLCNNEKCKFKDSTEDTTFPAKMFTCPVCGRKEEN